MNRQILDKLNGFFATGTPRTFRKGEMIIQASVEPIGISFLIDGLVEQYDLTPDGNKVTVNMFRPPAFFPMSWAINRTPNGYFYDALTDVEIRQVAAEDAVAFLKANPDVMFDLLSRVYKGTDALLKRLVLAASGIASSRLIFELLIEAYRFGTDVDDTRKKVKVRQSSLAARSGLARETVSRELHKLDDKGIVMLTKEGIVFDPAQLERQLDIQV